MLPNAEGPLSSSSKATPSQSTRENALLREASSRVDTQATPHFARSPFFRETFFREMLLRDVSRKFFVAKVFSYTVVLKKHVFIVLGSELWEDNFSSMFDLVKDYIVDVWELRKARLKKISAFHSLSVRMHLGNWGMLGAVVG